MSSSMDSKWTCQLKRAPQKITVGDEMLLSCEGEAPVPLKGDLKIIFPKKEDAFRLYVTKTLHVEDSYVDLKAASYRPGDFQGAFFVTDGARGFSVENLSFSVASVLAGREKPLEKPHGPFGPWREPFPPWLAAAWGLAALLGAVSIGLVLKRFFERKRFAAKIQRRTRGARPSKIFIRAWRRREAAAARLSGAPASAPAAGGGEKPKPQTAEESKSRIRDLEALFKAFLENLCLVPALNKSSRQILSGLKKYRRPLYKSHGRALLQVLSELECFRSAPPPEKAAAQLETSCRRLAFQLEDGELRRSARPRRKSGRLL